MAVKVDDKCIGCGLCVHLAPSVFEMTQKGVAVVIDPEGEIGTIASQCPVQAISQ